jgi:hypothetical protein
MKVACSCIGAGAVLTFASLSRTAEGLDEPDDKNFVESLGTKSHHAETDDHPISQSYYAAFDTPQEAWAAVAMRFLARRTKSAVPRSPGNATTRSGMP